MWLGLKLRSYIAFRASWTMYLDQSYSCSCSEGDNGYLGWHTVAVSFIGAAVHRCGLMLGTGTIHDKNQYDDRSCGYTLLLFWSQCGKQTAKDQWRRWGETFLWHQLKSTTSYFYAQTPGFLFEPTESLGHYYYYHIQKLTSPLDWQRWKVYKHLKWG